MIFDYVILHRNTS